MQFRYDGSVLEPSDRQDERRNHFLVYFFACCSMCVLLISYWGLLFPRDRSFIVQNQFVLYLIIILVTPLAYQIWLNDLFTFQLAWIPIFVTVATMLIIGLQPHLSQFVYADVIINRERRMEAVRLFDDGKIYAASDKDDMYVLPDDLADLSYNGIIYVDHLENIYFYNQNNVYGNLLCLIYSRDGEEPIKYPGVFQWQMRIEPHWYWYKMNVFR